MRTLLPLITLGLTLATTWPALGQQPQATSPDAPRSPTSDTAETASASATTSADEGAATPATPTANTTTPVADEPNARQEAEAASLPKVAVVVRGDADARLRRAAMNLEATLDGTLRLPSDSALRAALRGEGADDGLDGVRARRRGLGLGSDESTLRELARLVAADALVVVHAEAGTIYLEVFDAWAGRFFRDTRPLDPLETSARFVARAAQAAHRRARTGAPPSPIETAMATQAAPHETSSSNADRDDEIPPARAFFKKNWAYFVAAALLVGVVTFFVVRSRRNDDTPQPVLRFRPGPVE